MYKLRLSLLAVLCASAGLNAEGEASYAVDKGFNFLVNHQVGSATVVHYVTKKVAIVNQMHPRVQFLEKYKVDVAAGHVAHNFVKRAIVKGDGRSIDEIATDAGKDAAVSLAVTNVILPALKRVAYEMGFDYGSEYVEVKESTAYGVTHGACRWALDALLAFAKDQTAGK